MVEYITINSITFLSFWASSRCYRFIHITPSLQFYCNFTQFLHTFIINIRFIFLYNILSSGLYMFETKTDSEISYYNFVLTKTLNSYRRFLPVVAPWPYSIHLGSLSSLNFRIYIFCWSCFTKWNLNGINLYGWVAFHCRLLNVCVCALTLFLQF